MTTVATLINGVAKNLLVGSDVSGNLAAAHTIVDAQGADQTGTSGSGITQPTAGTGMLGWLSGIYKFASSLNGQSSTLNMSVSTVVKASAGRSFKVSVITAGTASTLNDCATTGAAAIANQVAVIPGVIGVYDINFPHATGIVYIPAGSQVASISYT